MSQLSIILKTAAVTSSVFLVGIFVAYRSGAFERHESTLPPPPLVETPRPDAMEPSPPPGSMIMGGSKTYSVGTLFPSEVVSVLPPPQHPIAISTPALPSMLFAGSKSGSISPIVTIPPSPPPAPAAQPVHPAMLLGGSKTISIEPIIPPKLLTEQALQAAVMSEALKRKP